MRGDLLLPRRSSDNLPTGHALVYFKDWEAGALRDRCGHLPLFSSKGGLPSTSREAKGLSRLRTQRNNVYSLQMSSTQSKSS